MDVLERPRRHRLCSISQHRANRQIPRASQFSAKNKGDFSWLSFDSNQRVVGSDRVAIDYSAIETKHQTAIIPPRRPSPITHNLKGTRQQIRARPPYLLGANAFASAGVANLGPLSKFGRFKGGWRFTTRRAFESDRAASLSDEKPPRLSLDDLTSVANAAAALVSNSNAATRRLRTSRSSFSGVDCNIPTFRSSSSIRLFAAAIRTPSSNSDISRAILLFFGRPETVSE